MLLQEVVPILFVLKRDEGSSEEVGERELGIIGGSISLEDFQLLLSKEADLVRGIILRCLINVPVAFIVVDMLLHYLLPQLRNLVQVAQVEA